MKRYLFTVAAFLLLTRVLIAYENSIDKIEVREAGGKVDVFISTSAQTYNHFTLSNPDRIVIDLLETVNKFPTNWLDIRKGNLLSVRSSQYEKGVARVVLDIEEKTPYHISKNKKWIVVRLEGPKEKSKELPSKCTAYKGRVDNIEVREAKGEVRVFISTNVRIYNDFTVSDPYKIMVNFYGAVYNLPTKRIDVRKGNLLSIRSSQHKDGIVRVILDLKEKTPYHITFKEKKGVIIHLKQPKKPKKVVSRSVFYRSRGKRDPFKAFIGVKTKGDEALLDAEQAALIGIMGNGEERYALLKGSNGKDYRLREGDRVRGGKVFSIEEERVVFNLRGFGHTRRVALIIGKGKREK